MLQLSCPDGRFWLVTDAGTVEVHEAELRALMAQIVDALPRAAAAAHLAQHSRVAMQKHTP